MVRSPINEGLESPGISGLPPGMLVERGETQKDVNYTVLKILASRMPHDLAFKALDLPCGTMLFLKYLAQVFPKASLAGADIVEQEPVPAVPFYQMDLTRPFTIPVDEKFDLVTSISGVMMFSNTLSFIENCVARLNEGGTIIVTNDNSATIMDRLAFLMMGRHRMFKAVFEDDEALTENVPVQELCRLLRKHNVDVEDITYTSFYLKDLFFLPFAFLVYPLHLWGLSRAKTKLPVFLVKQMYPFRHFFCKHYIITGRKR